VEEEFDESPTKISSISQKFPKLKFLPCGLVISLVDVFISAEPPSTDRFPSFHSANLLLRHHANRFIFNKQNSVLCLA
jgi:hypothetical protein